MERKIIPRGEDGRYEYDLKGLDEFAKDVAKRLLEKYPDVDCHDLKNRFDSLFNYEYIMEAFR